MRLDTSGPSRLVLDGLCLAVLVGCVVAFLVLSARLLLPLWFTHREARARQRLREAAEEDRDNREFWRKAGEVIAEQGTRDFDYRVAIAKKAFLEIAAEQEVKEAAPLTPLREPSHEAQVARPASPIASRPLPEPLFTMAAFGSTAAPKYPPDYDDEETQQ